MCTYKENQNTETGEISETLAPLGDIGLVSLDNK